MKKILAILGIGGAMVVGGNLLPLGGLTEAPVSSGPTYFAEVDKVGVVLRVIVADQAFINSGAVGNPANWKQTYLDGRDGKAYAGKGHIYNTQADTFAPVKITPVQEAPRGTATST